MEAAAIGAHSHDAHHWPVAVPGEGRARTAALHREGGAARSAAESIEATRGVPKPGVLQKAANAPVHRDYSAGDHLRRRPCSLYLAAKGLRIGDQAASRRAWSGAHDR